MADRATELESHGGRWPPTRRALLQALALLLVLPLFRGAPRPAPAAAQETSPPDFSDVTTTAAARRLVREGRLIEISLFPTELGDTGEPDDVSYTTPEAAEVRAMVIGTLSRFLERNEIDHLKVVPEYKGDSIVPSRITMTASHSGREGSIRTTIDVW